MTKEDTNNILKQYDECTGELKLFSERVRTLIEEILLANNFRVHSITSRIKERHSLEKKLGRPGKNYKDLSEIKDIIGIRIITHFADDVDSVARTIEREFEIDRMHSVDKRALLDPDRFGYLSLHYVLRLTAERRAMTEYKRIINTQAEVQVRSILQHAWAEIEHDLGYGPKTRLSIPTQIRRQFSRLAGLLELADEQFSDIRQELNSYEKEVPSQIEHSPSDVEINNISLRVFVKSSPTIQRLNSEIDSRVKEEFINRDSEDIMLNLLVNRLAVFEIRKIQQLEQLLNAHADEILDFAETWLEEYNKTPSTRLLFEFSISCLVLILIGRQQDVAKAEKLIKACKMEETGMSQHELAICIVNTYKTVSTAN